MTDEKTAAPRTGDTPPILGKTGPGGDTWAPGETPVSGPDEYRDSWNPRHQGWQRWRDAVRRWIGGGG